MPSDHLERPDRRPRRSKNLRRLATLSLAVGLAPGCARSPKPIRNVVLIGIDTLRTDHVGAYGYARPTTPALDLLSKKGVVLDAAYSTSNWTVPAVASVLTSRTPPEHGAGLTGKVRNLDGSSPPAPIRAGVSTLAGELRRAGFATAMFSANPFFYDSFTSGFEVSKVEPVPATTLVNRALDWLDKADSRRRFLYVHFIDVHQPNRAPASIRALFPIADGTAPDLSDGGLSGSGTVETGSKAPLVERSRALREAAYDASLRYVDMELGRLLASVARRDLSSPILIVVFSDHGEEFWDHEQVERSWGDDPRGIYGVGHGHTFFDELIHVPLILAGGSLPRGRRSPCIASLMDIAPTILGQLGLPRDVTWQGVDLATRLQGSSPDCGDRPIFASSPAYGPDGASVRLGPLKLIRRGDLPPLLFDLRSDPLELHDLAPARPAAVARLAELEREYRRSAFESEKMPALTDKKLIDQLRDLGYL
jgi:arylsulfatase A-like enzyme